jgi:hypothetical protein
MYCRFICRDIVCNLMVLICISAVIERGVTVPQKKRKRSCNLFAYTPNLQHKLCTLYLCRITRVLLADQVL